MWTKARTIMIDKIGVPYLAAIISVSESNSF